MRFSKVYIFPVLIVITFSCVVVKRSPASLIEHGERRLPLELHRNIFEDYLWATPPLYAKKIIFTENRFKLAFAGNTLEFEQLANDQIKMTENNYSTIASAELSSGNCYYDLDLLKFKSIMRERYSPRTVREIKRVSVTKTRTVSENVTVRKTKSVYDSSIHGNKTKSYNITETRKHTQTYTEYENRTIFKTIWEWKPISEQILDIPHFTVFKFMRQNGDQIIIYNSSGEYFFQHVSYWLANDSLLGTGNDNMHASMVFVDGNQDGFFDGANDYVFYNTWNPYKHNQIIPDIYSFRDNQWFQLQRLKDALFIGFKIDSFNILKLSNANTSFLNNHSRGRIKITNLPIDCKLEINGTQYLLNREGIFNKKIEYGNYKAIISHSGHLNQILNFTIDTEHPVFESQYESQKVSATFKVINHNFRNWTLTAVNDTGGEWRTFNNNKLSIPGGLYKFLISGGGNTFCKEAKVKDEEEWIYDFSSDSLLHQ